MPSFGSIGDAYVTTMMESFWSTMQIELLYRKKWKTRIELANAIFEFIEVFYNRQRRHSKIGYISPVEFEAKMQQQPAQSQQKKVTKHGAGQLMGQLHH